MLLTLKYGASYYLLIRPTQPKKKKNHLLFVMSIGFPLFFSQQQINNVITFRKIEQRC